MDTVIYGRWSSEHNWPLTGSFSTLISRRPRLLVAAQPASGEEVDFEFRCVITIFDETPVLLILLSLYGGSDWVWFVVG